VNDTGPWHSANATSTSVLLVGALLARRIAEPLAALAGILRAGKAEPLDDIDGDAMGPVAQMQRAAGLAGIIAQRIQRRTVEGIGKRVRPAALAGVRLRHSGHRHGCVEREAHNDIKNHGDTEDTEIAAFRHLRALRVFVVIYWLPLRGRLSSSRNGVKKRTGRPANG
jgi:hypothetical protein